VQSRLATVVEQFQSVPISTVAQMFADDASATQLLEAIQALQQQGKITHDLSAQKLRWNN
jgi:hypothetical protein